MRSRHFVVFGVFILLVVGLTQRGWALPHDGGADARAAIADAASDALDAAAADAEEDAEVEAEAPAIASAEPAASASASASAAPAHVNEAPREIAEGSPVRLHDKRVFAIRAKLGGITAEERARRASSALERAFEENETEDVRVDESQPKLAVVLVGNRPIVELTPDDADAAGDASLTVHAAGIGENVRSALKAERTRRDVSKRVFSWSLIIFSALILFLGVRKARDFAVSARTWITDNPKRLPALRIGSVEVMRPAAFQGLLRIGVTLIERTVQLAILYLWLVFVLAQFESTKDLGGKITTTILTPLGALVGRIALSLPLLVVGVIAIIAVFIVVRFIRLFFRSVEMGETQLAWLPPDLASATSAVMRLGVVIGALVLGAPLVTGSDQGTASRAGLVVLIAMGLALVPIFASMSVGFSTVFWRRLRIGDFVSFDGRQGRVANVTLFEVRVLDGEGSELRIPHLLTLVRPLRVSGAYPLATFEIVVDPKAPQEQVRKVMAASGASKHGEPRVRLLFIDLDGAHYEIVAKRALDEEDPATAVLRALSDAGIGLGEEQMNSLLLLMGLLLVAYLGSFLVGGERSVSGVGLPSSVEWVVLGAVIGPNALGVVSTSVVDGVQSVITVALSWLMLTAGVQYATTTQGNISFSRVLYALLWALVTAGAVFAAVYFGVARVAPELVKDRLVLALALAAVSCETTRHVMRWVRERHGARGPLTDLLEDISCAEDIVPVGILVALFSLAGKSKIAWLGIAGVSGVTVGLGAVLGALCAMLLGREFRLRESWGTILGMSLLAIGCSAMVGIAFVVVMFVMGAVLVLASTHAGEIRAMLQPTERGALLPLLIVCGVRLEPRALAHTFAIFGIVFAARVIAKNVLARSLEAASPDARAAGGILGFGMMSSGALSMCIGLVCAITFPGQIGNTVLAVSAALCIAGELVGPPALRTALRRVDELHDAPPSSEAPRAGEEAPS